MKKRMNTKKLTLITLLSGSIMLAGFTSAIANPNNMHQRCSGKGTAEIVLDEKTIELRKKFRDETTDLRKKMIVTRTELSVLMNSTTPDAKEAGRLAGELFDVKEQLKKKADESGLTTTGYMGNGHHMNGGGMMGRGMMGGRFGSNASELCDGPHGK